jgi:hypothetical protein
MEGKKNQRMTVKILNEEFDKKIQNLKETVESQEMRINYFDEKVKTLEEKLTKKAESIEKSGIWIKEKLEEALVILTQLWKTFSL